MKSPYCFVVMPFSRAFDTVYSDGIKPACQDVGITCERVDEQVFREMVLDRIASEIARADVIVADTSGRSPNVYYEVGLAHAKGKPTILVTQKAEDIAFDVGMWQHVVYGDDLLLLRRELTRHLRECFAPRVAAPELSGKWVLAIYDPSKPDRGTPYKVDGYEIRQNGKSIEGSIVRLFGAGVGDREYQFSGFTDGQEIVYAFWSTRMALHSWGCCNLRRTEDYWYEGAYHRPVGRSGVADQWERIVLTRADLAQRSLKLRSKKSLENLALWAGLRGPPPEDCG